MAGFVETTVNDIDRRLEELQEEVTKLQAARTALIGGRRGPGRPPRTEPREAASASETPAPVRRARRQARQGRPRGRRGGNTRSNQALELVRKSPGITIPQVAEQLKIEPNYLYRVMPKLVEDGHIRRDGNGWFPAGEAAAAE